MPKHEFSRVRQDVVRRNLQVVAKQQLTPEMLRLVFHSEELAGFDSPSPDDHIKIFLPAGPGEPAVMRDFTPRAWDLQAGTLTLDFALHPRGPAADWAREAQVGDKLGIGGPRGSTIVPNDFDWYLLIGDASALPSMGRRLEELPQDAEVRVIALVQGAEERAYLEPGGREVAWVEATGDVERDLEAVVKELRPLPPGDGFVWIAAEVAIARGLYRHAAGTLGHPKEWIKAAGYWSAGKADGGERIEEAALQAS